MRAIREKIAWIIAGALALGVAAAVATAVSGGSLDPPGPPSDTGPLEAVMIPPQARLIQIADDLMVPTSATSGAPTDDTPTPTSTATVLVALRPRQIQLVSLAGGTPTPLPIPGVSIDCGSCVFDTGSSNIPINVNFANTSGAPIQLGSFALSLRGDNQSSFSPTAPACVAPGTSCNPDLLLSNGNWVCGPPNPIPDEDGSATVTSSFISCFNGAGTGETVQDGETITLARVRFATGSPGVANLTLSSVNIADAVGFEVHACAPGPDPCNGAAVQVGTIVATNTPSLPATSTSTPPATNTAPSGPPTGALDLGHHDVRDCAEIALFVEVRAASGQTGAASLQVHAQLSATDTGNFGVLRFDGNAASWTIPVSSQATIQTQRATLFGQTGQDAPFLAVYAGQVPSGAVDLVLDAWLYCIPRS